jgi:hypothetical protein
MQIIDDPQYEGKTLTIIRVVNSGRRPVTISTVGAECLYPHDHFIVRDSKPRLPYELTEGKNVVAIIPPCDIDFSTVNFWYASDAVGSTYKFHVATWYSRVMSNVRWRRKWRRNRRQRAKAAKALKAIKRA